MGALSEDYEHRHMGTVALLRALEPNPNLPHPQLLIAEQFGAFTRGLLDQVPDDSPMLTDGLRKLWEAKNSIVFASLGKR